MKTMSESKITSKTLWRIRNTPVENKEYSSKEALENAFLHEIQQMKPLRVYKMYEDLNYRIKYGTLTDDERLTFAIASAETDIILAQKLGEDAALFFTREEKFLAIVQDDSYINLLITGVGIGTVVGLSCSPVLVAFIKMV
jgi:hypothetical protein